MQSSLVEAYDFLAVNHRILTLLAESESEYGCISIYRGVPPFYIEPYHVGGCI